MSIIFIRHGQSESNIGGVSQPNHLIMLTDKGKLQAQELAIKIQCKPERIYTSEYRRTQLTAAPLLDKFELQASVLPCLNEFNAYSYESVRGMNGQQRLPLMRRYWRECDPNIDHGPGSQSFNAFCRQVREFMTLLERGDIPDNSLIFGHGIWLSVFLWLRQFAITSAVTSQQMAEFFIFLKTHHPKNCQMVELIA